MIRPGGSSLSLSRSLSSSLRNVNSIYKSTDRLDERVLLLMPDAVHQREMERRNKQQIAATQSLEKITHDLNNNFVADGKAPSPPPEIAPVVITIDVPVTRVFNRRWAILFVFCFISLLNAFNWIEYSIIQDVSIAFYNESLPTDSGAQADAVNWFSMVYMLCYIPLVFPAMFLLDRKGLKLSIIMGALLTAIGAGIKCAAVRPDLFAVAMLGQTICAIAQAFTLGVPARLSALWFGPTQIALATSMGVFGNQLGTAIGFLVPPNVVYKSDSVEYMQKRFYILLLPMAALCLLALILAIIVIKDEPDVPPSLAQWEIRRLEQQAKQADNAVDQMNDFQYFKQSLINLFKNFNFVLILISYGINTGTYYSISTLLNQVISTYYENENEKIGLIGLILVLSGLLGAVIGGVVLDKTKAYKLTTFVFYACSFIAMVLFTATLSVDIRVVFGTAFLLGFFMTGYLPVGFELTAEVTYPEPEGTSCGLLNTSAQIFGIIYTYVQGRITIMYGALYGNILICASLLVGTIITGIIKSDLRRQQALNLDDNTTPTKSEIFKEAPLTVSEAVQNNGNLAINIDTLETDQANYSVI